jgi:hypothetical protein
MASLRQQQQPNQQVTVNKILGMTRRANFKLEQYYNDGWM